MGLPDLQNVDVKKCEKTEPIHPCDPQLPCDPKFLGHSCEKPYLCLEKIKSPALPGEITTCKEGNHMNVRACTKKPPPHPCDRKPLCSELPEQERNRVLDCIEPPLCIEKVKNPEIPPRKKQNPYCDETPDGTCRN